MDGWTEWRDAHRGLLKELLMMMSIRHGKGGLFFYSTHRSTEMMEIRRLWRDVKEMNVPEEDRMRN